MNAYEAKMKKFAKKANTVLFEDKLNIDVIKFTTSSKMTKTLGQYSVSGGINQSIKLSTLLLGEGREWKHTVIHELVHAWQFQTGRELGHGKSFHAMADHIRSIDPDINITTTRTSDFVAKAVASRRKEFGVKQYMLTKYGQTNFLRKLDPAKLTWLKAIGYSVAVSDAPIAVKHCKNLDSLIKARTCYNIGSLKLQGVDVSKFRQL